MRGSRNIHPTAPMKLKLREMEQDKKNRNSSKRFKKKSQPNDTSKMSNNMQPSGRTEAHPPFKKFKKKSKMKRKKTVESINNESDAKKQPVKVLSSNWQAFLKVG